MNNNWITARLNEGYRIIQVQTLIFVMTHVMVLFVQMCNKQTVMTNCGRT